MEVSAIKKTHRHSQPNTKTSSEKKGQISVSYYVAAYFPVREQCTHFYFILLFLTNNVLNEESNLLRCDGLESAVYVLTFRRICWSHHQENELSTVIYTEYGGNRFI